MRILHTEPWCYRDELLDRLRGVGDLAQTDVEDQLIVRQTMLDGDYDAIFLRVGMAVDRTLVSALPSVRHLITPTTGVEHIDLDACAALGVGVLSLRGSPILREVSATAEHTMSLMFALRRRLLPAVRSVHAGAWSRRDLIGSDLQGAVLGVVGYGRLGRKVAAVAATLGMTVLVHDVDMTVEGTVPDYAQWITRLDDLLPRVDVLSLHASLDARSEGLIDARRIASLKSGAMIVNTARGELIDETALLRGLESGRLGGAALDVLDGEARWAPSIPLAHPLWNYAAQHDNLILTPHIGGVSIQAIDTTRTWLVNSFIEEISSGT